MGSIQSGKTASMLGVTALAVDSGVDLVVILCGTKLSLWRQTYDRYLSQLDPPGSRQERARERLLVPSVQAMANQDARPSELYRASPVQMRKHLEARTPLVAMVMKHADHLRAIRHFLHETVFPLAMERGLDFRMVVLDDEADDGSILDAEAERGVDSTTENLKITPRLIADLWSRRSAPLEPRWPGMAATYLAYTATPQANFLQADLNPLAPQDFVVALRTPSDQGQLVPRQPTYMEPGGLKGFYTGGDVFYRRLSSSLVSVPSETHSEAIGDAVRAFLVAGAVRQWRRGTGLGPHGARRKTWPSSEELLAAVPPPHTALIHPSARLREHRAAAVDLLAWSWGVEQDAAGELYDLGERRLSLPHLRQQIEDDPGAWTRWLSDYQASADAVVTEYCCPARPVPHLEDWEEIRRLILEEIIPATKISVVNSDGSIEDRPDFVGREIDGEWSAPRDLCTIFVSGNVMSRGLTLEGLTTTLFYRTSDNPVADTQMQMQRWFGYRGKDLELCRVFLPDQQQRLFTAYNDADEALRTQVMRLMEELGEPPTLTVLGGLEFAATGKIANLSTVPLSPPARSIVSLMSSGREPDPNGGIIANLFTKYSSRDLIVSGRTRGRILEQSLSLNQAASVFDKLRYDTYTPETAGWMSNRWSNLERILGLSETDDASPLYRPVIGSSEPSFRSDCPYSIGAYLRLWAALLDRRAPGLSSTDDPSTPWAMSDLGAKSAQQPRFHVGIRYGNGPEVREGPLAHIGFAVRTMERTLGPDAKIHWGSQNPEALGRDYLGDHLFDYHLHQREPDRSSPWRPVGHPGLILFHVIERPDLFPTVAVGLSLPLGGPEQLAAKISK